MKKSICKHCGLKITCGNKENMQKTLDFHYTHCRGLKTKDGK